MCLPSLIELKKTAQAKASCHANPSSNLFSILKQKLIKVNRKEPLIFVFITKAVVIYEPWEIGPFKSVIIN
jgi:hypothetical protein